VSVLRPSPDALVPVVAIATGTGAVPLPATLKPELLELMRVMFWIAVDTASAARLAASSNSSWMLLLPTCSFVSDVWPTKVAAAAWADVVGESWVPAAVSGSSRPVGGTMAIPAGDATGEWRSVKRDALAALQSITHGAAAIAYPCG
jgi:hypothetical protein